MSVLERKDPITHGPRPDQLHERNARQALERLLDEGGRHRYGRHRTHQEKRRDDDRLARGTVVDDAIEHTRVEAEWRVDVAVGEQHGVVALHHLAAKDEFRHRETISCSLTTRGLTGPDAVGQSDRRERAQEVA
jgi:hypothetical protein